MKKHLSFLLNVLAAVTFVTAWNLLKRASMPSVQLAFCVVEGDLDKELRESLGNLNKRFGKLDEIEKSVTAQTKATDALTTVVSEVQQKLLGIERSSIEIISAPRIRQPGKVSDACAKHLAAQFILHCEKSGKLEALATMPVQREGLATVARQVLGITPKAAITTTDIPLPVQFGTELKELISEFGVVRRKMSPYPIGLGVARPPRFGVRPAFGSIAMSAAVGEKSPTIDFASLESHKLGGLVRLPREIDEQSIVPMGQYLARYGAIEFARAEDLWGFLADGTATYENVKGIVKVARDNTKTVVLATTKTKPSDATLADFRLLRTKVNKAALSANMSAYYLDSTWETALPGFRTTAEPLVYQRLPDGTAILDGYPIVWTDVLTPYGTAAAADQPLAVFGALDYWWFGQHGSPRIDTSEHVFFANDQLATRFLEEIDFDYADVAATAALITAAS
jgi:HK97 family phage major capsid protein